jgi:hypothetical protein
MFLVQYNGKVFDPVPLMLRGFALTGFLQAATSFVIFIQNPELSTLRLAGPVLWISVGNQLVTTVVAWYLYYVFLRFRKA